MYKVYNLIDSDLINKGIDMLKRFISLILVCGLAAASLPLTGCKDSKAGTAEAVSFASGFIKALKERDINYLKSKTEGDGKKVWDKLSKLDSDPEKAVYNAVWDTFSYNIDTEASSYDRKSGSAVINGNCEYCDLSTLIADDANLKGQNSLIAAVKDAGKTASSGFRLNLIGKDDSFVLLNPEEIGKDLSFLDLKIEYKGLAPDKLADYVDWFNDKDDSYTNTDKIELDLFYSKEVFESRAFKLYYVVKKDGSDVYISPEFDSEAPFNKAVYGADQGAVLDEQGFLSAGEYEIDFFLKEGDIRLKGAKCSVKTETVEAETSVSDEKVPSSTDNYLILDEGIKDGLEYVRWWKSGGGMPGEGLYDKGSSEIAFTLEYSKQFWGEDTDISFSVFRFDDKAADPAALIKYMDKELPWDAEVLTSGDAVTETEETAAETEPSASDETQETAETAAPVFLEPVFEGKITPDSDGENYFYDAKYAKPASGYYYILIKAAGENKVLANCRVR